MLGYFGANNFGDDALLADWLLKHASWLTERGLVCDVLSRCAEPLASFVEQRQLAPLLGRSILPRQALKLPLGEYAALIAPGGSLLQDTTSLRSLLFYLWVIHRFQQAGKPTILLHQGLGPLRNALGAFLCGHALKHVRLLTVRDAESMAWLELHPLLGKLESIALSADPILTAEFAAPATAASAPAPYAVLIPKRTGDLPYRGDPTTEVEALTSLARHIRAVSDLEVCVLPFHGGQDSAFCAELAAHASLRLLTAPAPAANAIWHNLAHASLVVSYRLHGLVSAAAHGIPALGVAYDPKVSAFCDAAELPWCFPAQVHEPEALQAVSELWNTRESTATARQTALAAMRSRLAAAETRFAALW